MTIIDLYHDFGIQTAPEGHKHHREGWINVPCPYCSGTEGFHLGFNLQGSYFYCWRCDYHPVVITLQELLRVDWKRARQLADYYHLQRSTLLTNPKNDRVGKLEFKQPSGVDTLTKAHKNYLFERGFNPITLVKNWRIAGTGPVSKLDDINYNHRIFIPIYWQGRMVSFQTRDRTNKHPMKYLAAPMEREVIHHKHLVYCSAVELPHRVGICVEGVFDVWRLGARSFGLFGISYTHEQMTLIANNFDRVVIWFDPEPQAQQQAEKLKSELNFRGVEAVIVTTDKDPADIPQDEADYIVKQLI